MKIYSSKLCNLNLFELWLFLEEWLLCFVYFLTILCAAVLQRCSVSLRPATLLKKRLWHTCFPVNFAKFLRIPFLTEHLWWLPLFVFIRVGQMIMLKNGNLDIIWSSINFWSVIQNGTFFLKFFIHLQSRSLG